MSERAVREHRFAATAGEICWFEWGQRGGGPTLVLLHATGFHARLWDRVVAALPADAHVIAVDLRGHGRSYCPASLVDWPETARDVIELIDHLDLRGIIGAGHSLGGACILHAAAEMADRFAALTLIDPVILEPADYPDPLPPLPDFAAHPVARRKNRWQGPEEMIERFKDREPYATWAAGVLADYCTWGLLPAADGDGWQLACPADIEVTAYAGYNRHNPFKDIARVTCPTTILRGRNGVRAGPGDFSVSPTLPRLATFFADGTDQQWNDCTHFIPMEQPERVAQVLAAQIGATKQG